MKIKKQVGELWGRGVAGINMCFRKLLSQGNLIQEEGSACVEKWF
jgi:hypothetical protein